jgi:hypothetical protein
MTGREVVRVESLVDEHASPARRERLQAHTKHIAFLVDREEHGLAPRQQFRVVMIESRASGSIRSPSPRTGSTQRRTRRASLGFR